MNALSFLNQPLLWGLGLASIPIIIHLLFRRRFRQIDWAPIKYLKLSLKRNRRRIRLEQVLLLLLRTAIILLLFFTVARPVMHAAGLGSWLAGRSRTNQLLLVDDSLSMGFRQRGRSAFERAQELAAEVIRTIGPQDRLTIVLSSRPDAPLRREVEVTDSAELTSLIKELQVSDTLTSWHPTLAAIDELVKAGTYPIHEVTLITDLRRTGWDPQEFAKAGLESSHTHLRILDVGVDRQENVALTALAPVERVALAGAPSIWEATIQNRSTRQIEGLEATLSIDGKPGLIRLPAIAPGETAQVPVSALFQEPGLHWLSLKLPDDDLPADNLRFAALDVRETLRILLIDGEPSSDPLASETDFLALALSLSASEASAWQVELLTDAEWSAAQFVQPDLLILANIARVPPRQLEEVERMVKSGTGLMVFLGSQVDADDYNRFLYREGTGLLPAELEALHEEKLNGLLVEDLPGSPLAPLRQLTPAALERIQVGRFMALRPAPQAQPAARVLARWNNPDNSPAAIDRAFGRGRVLLWSIAADKEWSDWPTDPSYVLAMREAAKAIVRGDAIDRQLTAGDPLRREVPRDHEITNPTVEVPGGESPLAMQLVVDKTKDKADAAGETAKSAESAQSTASPTIGHDDTRHAGLYRIAWRDNLAGPQTDLYFANPAERESDLARMPADELRELLRGIDVEIVRSTSEGDLPIALRGKEIWRSLAATLLGLLMVEACFATWAGRQR